MQGLRRDVQQHTSSLEIPIISYKDVFNDGEDKLHLGVWCGALFALSRVVYPGMEHISIKPDQIRSVHVKKKNKSFLIKVPNQSAEVFSTSQAGSLVLTQEDFQKLSLLGADINYFHHSTNTSMFTQIANRTVATGDFTQVQALFVDKEGKPDYPAMKAHFGLPGKLMIGQTPTEDGATIWGHVQEWTKLVLAKPEDKAYESYLPFVLGGKVGETELPGFVAASEQLWDSVKATATTQILEVFPEIQEMATTDGVVNEAEAVAYVAGSLQATEAGYALGVTALDITADNIKFIADGIGLNVPAAFGPADPADVAAAIETAVVENVPAPAEGVVTAEDFATEAPVDVLEINAAPENAPIPENLPAIPTAQGSSLPAGFVAVSPKALQHAGRMATALGDFLNELATPSVAEAVVTEEVVAEEV